MERAAAEAARRGDEHAQAAGPPQPAQQAPRPADGQRPGGRAPDPRFDPAKVKYVADTQPFMSTWKIPFTDIATDVPCFEPPWSMIGVIDLNTNKLLWRRPLGSMKKSGPFGIQSGLPFMVGTPVQAGSITTRGGLIFHGGAMDSTFRAFDLRTGEVRWESDLPGSAHATPMTYVSAKTGKQYVVITVPNPTWQYPRYNAPSEPSDDQGGYVIAYALPDAAN
jgi:quinoprotein glucose dehydrogenase/quinate dehydrogenase (quinone)